MELPSFLFKDYIFIPLVGICVFLITYLWANKFVNYLYSKSLGEREEIFRRLDLMFIEVDKNKLTILMLLLSFGLGAIIFFLLWPNAMAGILAGAVVTAVGWRIPQFLVASLFENRCTKFVDQMVDGLTIMANGVKAGLSITQSMERVVENLGNPISQEFGLVLSQIRIGRTVEEALLELGERIPKPDVQMFVTSINILKETGGNLAETFATIVTVIRERQKVEKKIQALTAQGLMQGLIITLVPFALLVVFLLIDPNYVMPMFTTGLGLFFFAIMLILQVIGGFMIRKIVKIKV